MVMPGRRPAHEHFKTPMLPDILETGEYLQGRVDFLKSCGEYLGLFDPEGEFIENDVNTLIASGLGEIYRQSWSAPDPRFDPIKDQYTRRTGRPHDWFKDLVTELETQLAGSEHEFPFKDTKFRKFIFHKVFANFLVGSLKNKDLGQKLLRENQRLAQQKLHHFPANDLYHEAVSTFLEALQVPDNEGLHKQISDDLKGHHIQIKDPKDRSKTKPHYIPEFNMNPYHIIVRARPNRQIKTEAIQQRLERIRDRKERLGEGDPGDITSY